MAKQPNSSAREYPFANLSRPTSSTGMPSIPCTTPRRNTSRQEWIDMTVSTQNCINQSRPQTVMSPTEQIGSRIIPSATSHYSTSEVGRSISTQPFPVAFDIQSPSNTPGPNSYFRPQNQNFVISTSSFGIHGGGGITSQMSIPFSPIPAPDFRRYDQSPVIIFK